MSVVFIAEREPSQQLGRAKARSTSPWPAFDSTLEYGRSILERCQNAHWPSGRL